MRTRILVVIASILTVCTSALAKSPTHTVFSQTNALAISYAIESNEIRSILSATNHEEFAVVCNASMKSDNHEILDKQKDNRIAAGKTFGFVFKYRPSIKKIEIFLTCEPAAESRETARPQTSTDNKNDTGHSIVPHQLDTKNEKQAPVIIEDLDNSTPRKY